MERDIDMRQTVEEAAKLFANRCRIANCQSSLDYPYDDIDMINAFKAGAEWQAKQSPWVSVKERLPEAHITVITKGAYGYLICYLSTLGEWETGIKVNEERLGITHWCHIPDLGE
jgi:hypothetical protein